MTATILFGFTQSAASRVAGLSLDDKRSDASLPPVVSLTADIFDSADNEISAETAGFLKRGFVTPSLGGACKLNSHNARKYHKNKDQIQGSMKLSLI